MAPPQPRAAFRSLSHACSSLDGSSSCSIAVTSFPPRPLRSIRITARAGPLGGGGLQQLQLQGGKGGEQARIDPPARVGSPAQRPQLGAGGVHEHAIGVPRSAGDLDQMACVRAPGTRPQPVEALQVDVVREDAGPLRGEQKRLSPGPRAQVEHGFARLRFRQMAQELAALVLRLEQTFAPRAGAEEVRARRLHEQGVGSERRWRGLDPFVEKVRRELLAGTEQAIGAQADGAGNGNRCAELFRGLAQLGDQVRLQPIRERPPIGKPLGSRVPPAWLRGAGQRHRASVGDASEIAQQRGEQLRGRVRSGLPAQAPPPERDTEDRFHQRGPLVARQATLSPQDAVHVPLGRGTLQHGRDRGDRDAGAQRIPRYLAQAVHPCSMSHERQGGCPFLHAPAPIRIFRPMDDPRQLLGEGRFEELANDDHPLWRGLALLELKRWPEAARTFEEAPDASQSGTMLELAGAARWLAGQRETAVERWAAALDAGYEGPASRLKPPALLLYAGTRLGDDRYVLRGTRLMTKIWKPKIQRIWPGPVAGFLLG